MGILIGCYSNNAMKAHTNRVSISQEVLQDVYMCNQKKDPKQMGKNITFREIKSYRLFHPHIDALVITLIMANIKLYIILIDISNLVDVMFLRLGNK